MLLNVLLTLIPLIFAFVLLLLSMKRRNRAFDQFSIFEYFDSGAIRALFSVVIVYVHVPQIYGNPLQDAIGSFAGVGVSFFFMMSSFGCCNKYFKEKPKHFFISFWPKRIVSLFLPNLLINFFYCIWCLCYGYGFYALRLLYFNQYIYAVLVLYFVLYLFFVIDFLLQRKHTTLLLLLCSTISATMSVVTFLTKIHFYFLWPVESLFGAVGILVYLYNKRLSSFFKKNVASIFVLSLGASVALGFRFSDHKSPSFAANFIFKFLLILIILVSIVSFTVVFKFRKRPIIYLSNISFGIFLSHLTFIPVISRYFDKSFSSSTGVYIITVFGISIIVSVITFLLCKPVLYLMSRMFRRV